MRTFDFTQSDPAAVWTITHNLGGMPALDVTVDVNGQVQKILPLRVEATDNDTLTVHFSSPQTGTARLVIDTSEYKINFPV
jgi:hypothetical protein